MIIEWGGNLPLYHLFDANIAVECASYLVPRDYSDQSLKLLIFLHNTEIKCTWNYPVHHMR
jgi:hypothetical protein